MQSVQLNRCFRRPFSVELWIPLNIYSPIFNEWVMLIRTIQLKSCLHKMESTVNIPRKNSIFNRLIDNSVNQNAVHFVINQCLRLLVPSNVRCSTAFGRSISGHSQFLCSPRLHAFCTVFIYKQNGCWTLPSVKKFVNFCPSVQYCSCAAQYFFFYQRIGSIQFNRQFELIGSMNRPCFTVWWLHSGQAEHMSNTSEETTWTLRLFFRCYVLCNNIKFNDSCVWGY